MSASLQRKTEGGNRAGEVPLQYMKYCTLRENKIHLKKELRVLHIFMKLIYLSIDLICSITCSYLQCYPHITMWLL